MRNNRTKDTGKFNPYTGDSYTLKNTGKGIYMIYEKDKLVYVGKSHSHIQNTLYRHFQRWIDKRSSYSKQYSYFARVTYYGKPRKDYLVRCYFVNKSNDSIDALEQYLIKKHNPRDNTQKLDYYTASQLAEAKEEISWYNVEKWNPENEDLPF